MNAITKKLFLLAVSVATSSILFACTNPGGGGGGDDSDNSSSSSTSSGNSGAVTTRCGAVANGTYKNPISSSDGIAVQFISAVGPNLVLVKGENTDSFLVRLQGLSSTIGSVSGAAESQIRTFSANGLFFVPAGDTCTESTVSGIAQIGSLFNSKGAGLAELLASTGAVKANASDVCGGDKIGTCLAALAETPPASATAGELARLLWKPSSDSNGQLAVHTAPFNSVVRVNGETGQNQGPGNGYGSLARFSRSGCAYGNARVQVFNSKGVPFTVGGKTTFSIPNGCNRYCLEDGNGSIVPCSK